MWNNFVPLISLLSESPCSLIGPLMGFRPNNSDSSFFSESDNSLFALDTIQKMDSGGKVSGPIISFLDDLLVFK